MDLRKLQRQAQSTVYQQPSEDLLAQEADRIGVARDVEQRRVEKAARKVAQTQSSAARRQLNLARQAEVEK